MAFAHVLFKNNPRWHWRFQLRDVEEPAVVFIDHLAVHVIELPKFNRVATELATGCERWSYFLRHGAELDTDRLPVPLQTLAIQKAMEVLRMLTQNDLEREKYEARLKYQRDEEARRKYAEQAEERGEKRGEERGEKRGEERGEKRGEERGEKRGEKRGEERGELMGRVELLERLLKLEQTPKESLRTMKLEQLRELADQLETRLVGRG